MKSTQEIFKNNSSLLYEPEVVELLAYCEQLQDEIVEFKFQKTNNKELLMLDMQCSSAGIQTLRLTNIHKLISN